MAHYEVSIFQKVEEFITINVKAKNKKKAVEKALKASRTTDSKDWEIKVTDLDTYVEEVKEKA